jgi:hypothetical protein
MPSYLRKTPLQMRREAERTNDLESAKPLGEADSSRHPCRAGETRAQSEGTADWLTHIRTGRIMVH